MAHRQSVARNSAPAHRQLPAREMAVFKNMLKEYELKKYASGLDLCEQILANRPEHGETLCMRGLFLVNLDRKAEGIAQVKLGIRQDLTSHICWHVYGLIHRADRNYTEAVKCYLQALKFDPNNFQILRDLALLQTQLRQYDRLATTRASLLQFQPKNPAFWIALALANHLAGRDAAALKVMESYEEAVQTPEKPHDYEASEVALFKNLLLEEAGHPERALTHLETVRDRVCDRLAWLERRAALQFRLQRFDAAETTYRGLLDRNPDDRLYLWRWLQARRIVRPGLSAADLAELQTGVRREPLLTDETAGAIVEATRQLLLVHPRSHQLNLIPLYFTYDDEFRRQADTYLRKQLDRGVPSLFSSLKPLYAHQPAKGTVLHDLVQAYKDSLPIPPVADGNSGAENGADRPAAPPAYVWALYYLAQHADHQGYPSAAMIAVEEALRYCPDLLDLHMARGRFLKHLGDPATASQVMEAARQLEPQDRFTNNKCVKYYLRNDQTVEAQTTILQFVRKDVPDMIYELYELQVLWYLLEAGDSFQRQRYWGLALKRFHQVDRAFQEFNDDQFDFHTYSLRKLTLRSYLDILKFEDGLYTRPQFRRAALAAADIYLTLHSQRQQDPARVATYVIARPEDAPLPPAPTKGKCRAKKQEVGESGVTSPASDGDAKADQVNKEEEEGGKKKEEEDSDLFKVVPDLDPFGNTYLEAEDYLAEALKLLQPLLALPTRQLDVERAAFRLHLAHAKYDSALTALQHLIELDPTSALTTASVAEFLAATHDGSTTSLSAKAAERANQVLGSWRPDLTVSQGPEATIQRWLETSSDSLDHACAAAEFLAAASRPAQSDRAYATLQAWFNRAVQNQSETRPLSLDQLDTLTRTAERVHDPLCIKDQSFLQTELPLTRAIGAYAAEHFPQAIRYHQVSPKD
ncbi:hypothetical protein IWQ60_003873 [Tieghemiomyces parasiticus]|uniref:Uncharacterized protein n=1 Tax=Tieghemiomyces parasiticus TaxID=78921 RepID=A0A9W8ACG0_9FUNG|nr:hypothetical protein IWQ60_003873 [Tieghemiomyces parasiticus]